MPGVGSHWQERVGRSQGKRTRDEVFFPVAAIWRPLWAQALSLEIATGRRGTIESHPPSDATGYIACLCACAYLFSFCVHVRLVWVDCLCALWRCGCSVLCRVLFCYVKCMLCHAVSCCAVLCCAVLCCAVLCCAVLCCACTVVVWCKMLQVDSSFRSAQIFCSCPMNYSHAIYKGKEAEELL